MQKVFKECLTLDRRAQDRYDLSSDIMMEHAARSIADILHKRRAVNHEHCRVLILCGPGDNGADGYALARLLMPAYQVTILALYTAKSNMAIKQRDRALKLGIPLIEHHESMAIDALPEADIYVDALFGAAQHRQISTTLKNFLHTLNHRQGLKIACDIPTGLYEYPFKADITVTMGALKEDLLEDRVKDAVGEIIVADLGIPRTFYESETDTFLLDESDLRLPFRSVANSHKGSYGFLSVIKGAQSGASILSSLAATRFGAGIVALVGVGDKPSEIMQMPEISEKTTAIAVGMGLGENIDHVNLTQLLNYPLIVDADLCYSENFIQSLKDKTDVVFTPHPKEFSTLLHNAGIDSSKTYTVEEIQQNRLKLARAFSLEYRGVLLLKGANTLIAQQGIVYISTLGTNRLAKGGSGDVLAGMIGALLAQGNSSLEAAIQSVLAHSLVAKYSPINDFSFTPLDLIEGLKTLS